MYILLCVSNQCKYFLRYWVHWHMLNEGNPDSVFVSDLQTQDTELEKDQKESVWKQSQHMLKTRRLKIARHPREVIKCLEKDGRRCGWLSEFFFLLLPQLVFFVGIHICRANTERSSRAVARIQGVWKWDCFAIFSVAFLSVYLHRFCPSASKVPSLFPVRILRMGERTSFLCLEAGPLRDFKQCFVFLVLQL